MKRKIKAYSLIELMVGMVLSTFIIAVAYQGYLLFSRQLISFKLNSEQNANFSSMDRLLFSDFMNSEVVRKEKDIVVCMLKDKIVRYQWSHQNLLRNQGTLTDTFQLDIINLRFGMDNRKVAQSGLIDEIVVEGIFKQDSVLLHYKKQYGADVFVNSNNSLENGGN
jgi:type II secretory pathway pseudopilin PulG